MVEQVFRMHGHDPKGVTCPAIDGIIDEAQDIAGEIEDPEVLDAAFCSPPRGPSSIAGDHPLRHAVAWAKQLGRDDCASVLHQILDRRSRPIRSSPDRRSKVNTKAAVATLASQLGKKEASPTGGFFSGEGAPVT